MLAIILSALFGLLFGSFANVVIWRLPRGESISHPGSHCPKCMRTLAWYENIPVFSWIALRGRCRSCREPIAFRYPLVELLTASVFALMAWRVPRDSDLVAYLPLAWVLIVLSFIDLDHKLLPNKIVLPSIAAGVVLLGIAAAIGPGMGDWVRALIGGAGAFAFFLIVALISPAGMGMGDVKLSALLGMALGYIAGNRVFIGLFAGFLLGAIGGIALMATGKGGRKTQVPFGPYLAAGTIIGIVAGAPLARLWLRT